MKNSLYSMIVIGSCNLKAINCPIFPFPSLLVLTPFTKGGGGVGWTPPAISKTFASMNLKFCRTLETSLNVLEI